MWADYLGSVALVGRSTDEAAACGVVLLPVLREVVLRRNERGWRFSHLARRAACIAVGRIAPPTIAAAEFLAEVVEADDVLALDAARSLRAFGALARCAVPALLKRAELANFDFIAELPFLLASVGSPEAIAWLKHQLETETRPLMRSLLLKGIAQAQTSH